MTIRRRSPEETRAYFQGWNAALEAAAKIARKETNADIFKDVVIAQHILEMRQTALDR